MKKILTVFLLFFMFSVTLFAEFILSPSIGYSIYKSPLGRPSDNFGNVKIHSLDASLDMEFCGLTGFTFLFSSDLAINGRVKMNEIKYRSYSYGPFNEDLKGANLKLNLIFGYTLRLFDSLYITGGAGLGLGGAKYRLMDDLDGDLVSGMLGIPIYVGIQYYFTKIIGINLAANYTPGVAGLYSEGSNITFGGYGFSNSFVIKMGPTFRF